MRRAPAIAIAIAIAVAVAIALLALGCSSDTPDGTGDLDAAVGATDAAPDAPLVAVDASAAGSDAAPDARSSPHDAASATCSPPCGPGEVCCPDSHGHFPRCIVGAACP